MLIGTIVGVDWCKGWGMRRGLVLGGGEKDMGFRFVL